MKEIGIRELKNEASRVIAEVEAGGTVTVTRRGKPVARIVAAETSHHLATLIAAGGEFAPVMAFAASLAPIRFKGPGKNAAELVSEGRR